MVVNGSFRLHMDSATANGPDIDARQVFFKYGDRGSLRE